MIVTISTRYFQAPAERSQTVNPYEILYEDDDLLVANKIAPLPVQKDKSGDEDLQSMILRERAASLDFLEAAHRIDRRTSGVVVFAKNLAALRALGEEFRERDIGKTYVACLEKEPTPSNGTLRHMMMQDPRRNIAVARPLDAAPGKGAPGAGAKSAAKSAPNSAARAELSYSLILRTDRYFFVEAKPLTGRHHQIRAQFAAMGWPIKGDLKYGARRSTLSGRIMLHAWKIELVHPMTGAALSLTAPLPTDETLWQVLAGHFAEQAAAPEADAIKVAIDKGAASER
jgi:23S rRNA pseudouridine1911/1915/1917 synthase